MYIVLIRGGIPRWALAGHPSSPETINLIPVPPTALFSASCLHDNKPRIIAAEFRTEEAAQAAIDSTLAYAAAQREMGIGGFDWKRNDWVIVQVPGPYGEAPPVYPLVDEYER